MKFRMSRCLSLLVIAVSISAQTQEPNKLKYEALLEKVKAGDTSVSFKDLRMAYAESKGYAPYGSDTEARNAMVAALNEKNYDKALEHAGSILTKNYLDITAHIVSSAAYGELKNAERAKYHRAIVEGLAQSIMKSGDGKTLDTAFVVISTNEEYALFNLLGMKVVAQALVNDKGHSYDKMDAIDRKTEQKTTFYFNIDIPFNWLANSLKR